MMAFVIFISGVPNAGKSTIAAGLAGSIANTEFIDGDFVFSEQEEQALKNVPLSEKWRRKLEKIVELIKQKLALNRNITVAWPLSQEDYNYVRSRLAEEVKLFCIFLNPDLESFEKNRAARPITTWDKKRGYEMHLENYPKQHFWDLVLDTTNHLPFDTINVIKQVIK